MSEPKYYQNFANAKHMDYVDATLLRHMAEHPEPQTSFQIAKAIGITSHQAKAACLRLVEAKSLRSVNLTEKTVAYTIKEKK